MKVISNTAMSADGKIGTAAYDHVALGSEEDLRRMGLLRAWADAVLVGGATFRNAPIPMVERPGQAPPRARRVLNVVFTRQGVASAVPAGTWPDPRVDLLVLGPDALDRAAHEALGARVQTTASPSVEWALDRLAAEGCRQVLVEGGGDLLFQLLAANRLDEMYLTVCPWIVGGAASPTPADGTGFSSSELRGLELIEVERVGEEVYLRYAVGRAVADAGGRSM